MIEQDIFVGLVATATGLFVMWSAIADSDWVNRFWLAKRIQNLSDDTFFARIAIGAIGACCAVLGVLLLLGFFPSEARKSNPSANQFADRDNLATQWI